MCLRVFKIINNGLKSKQGNHKDSEVLNIQPQIEEYVVAKNKNDALINEGNLHLAALDIVKIKLKVKRYKIEKRTFLNP